MLDDVLWEKGERHLHIFIHIMWRVKVHVLDVSAGKMCPLCADCAVPKKFRRNHVSGVHSEFKRIIDQVTTNSDANAVGVFFLWTMINDDSTILTVRLVGMYQTCLGERKKIALVPLVMPALPCAN
jgi:hypothetical protein